MMPFSYVGVGTVADLLDPPMQCNQMDVLRWEGIAIVSTLMSRAASHHLTEQAVEAIGELLSHTSWLGGTDWIEQRMRYRDEVHACPSCFSVLHYLPVT
jgi:hypothetical protein